MYIYIYVHCCVSLGVFVQSFAQIGLQAQTLVAAQILPGTFCNSRLDWYCNVLSVAFNLYNVFQIHRTELLS